MVLITILALIAFVLIALAVAAIVVGGSAFIVIFADVFVCAAIIGWIIYKLIKKRRE